MANFCCSIELEPRTLKQEQLNHAREIAVDIVQKNELDEASTIFNEGRLKEVVGMKEPPLAVVVSGENTAEEGGRVVKIINEEINVETCCQCLVVETSPECRDIKEPFSAPF